MNNLLWPNTKHTMSELWNELSGLLNNKDIMDFEYESRLKVAYSIPPLNDRDKHIPELNKLLLKLGFDRQKA